MGKAVITLMFISVLFISTFHATPTPSPNGDQALCGIKPFGGCDPGYLCCRPITTSNLGFCAVSCPGDVTDVLCAVDGDCGDLLMQCCGSGGIISSTRFCLDKRLRCPSADDVLCAEDGDCGDLLMQCCGSGGIISSTRFCLDKRLRCPSADDVLCAEDGDCGDLLMQCCPPFIGQSEGFCLSKELICPDSVSAHAERGLSLEETDMNDWVWNALCVMVFTAFIITVGFVTYYCLMMHCVPSRSVKVKWQKVDNPQSDEEEEELI
eukprot:1110810_1